MDLKTELFKDAIILLIGALLGAFIFSKFAPKPLHPVPPSQSQSAKCTASIKKHTNPDGSSDESLDLSGQAEQSQKPANAPIAPQNYLAIGGYMDSSFKGGSSLGLKINDWDFDISSDLKADHRFTAKYILIKF